MSKDKSKRFINQFKFKSAVNLYCFTDVHLGAAEHDAEAFKIAITQCKKDPNGYCFFNGDNMEIIPPDYGIPESGQDYTNSDQVREFVRILKYLGSKVLFIRNGNHDQRILKLSGVDIIQHISDNTKIPMLHTGMESITIWVGKKKYEMVTSHGEGGGSKKILNNMKLIFPGADVYFSGHTHELYCNGGNLRVDRSSNYEELRPVLEMVGGSFLGWADYARELNRVPTRTGYYILSFTEKEVVVKEGRVR